MRIEEANILCGTPNYTNTFPAEVYASHMQCVATWTRAGLQFRFQVEGRQFVHFARSRVCNLALDSRDNLKVPYTHILWLDDDAVIPDPEFIFDWIEHDRDVIIAPYPMRRAPHEIGILSATEYHCGDCGHTWHDDHDLTKTKICPECGETGKRQFHSHGTYRNFRTEDLNKGLQDVDGGGTHCMLMKADVLSRAGILGSDAIPPMVREFLENLGDQDRDLIDHYLGDVGDPSLSFEVEDREHNKPHFMMPRAGTEDMLWCYRAKCKGIEILCDTDAWADHVGFAPVITKTFTEKFEEAATQQGLEEKKGIAMVRVGDTGRDHTAHNTTREVSLG
jgi:hypothetical protein